MPTETSKVGPRADEQMNCSSAHLLTLKPASIRSDIIRHPLKNHRPLGRIPSDIP